jgi:hypothetical protein
MNALSDISRNCGNSNLCAWQVLGYLGSFLWLSAENPLWGAGRIGEQLRLLGYEPPCNDTIVKYMVRPRRSRSLAPRTSSPRPSSAGFIRGACCAKAVASRT